MTDTPKTRFDLEQESSLCNWYPKIFGKIPTPRTRIMKLTADEIDQLRATMDGVDVPEPLKIAIRAETIGLPYPIFLRTDQASGKHDWKDTCFVPDQSKLFMHIANLVSWHECAGFFGLHFEALIFREYLPLQSQFTAFNGMPVAPEWRFYVNNGVVTCEHFYWPENSIWNPSIENWKDVLHRMTLLSKEDADLLRVYTEIFGRENPGFWSVDFALTWDKDWVMIDAALGEISWHPESCQYCPEEQKTKLDTKITEKIDFDAMFEKKPES